MSGDLSWEALGETYELTKEHYEILSEILMRPLIKHALMLLGSSKLLCW